MFASKPHNRESAFSKVRAWLAPFVILIAVIVIRGGHVDTRGLWEDESIRYYRSLGNEGALTAGETIYTEAAKVSESWQRTEDLSAVSRGLRDHTEYLPAYYYLLNFTTRAIGPRKYATLKLWNVFFSLGTVLIVWKWCFRSLSPAAGAVAVTGLLLSAWDMAISLQLKEYALATLCVTGSTFFLWDILQNRGKRASAAGYGIFVGIGLMTHLHVWLVVTLQVAFTVISTRLRGTSWRYLVFAGTAALLPLLLWGLYTGRAQMETLQIDQEAFGDTYVGLSTAAFKLGTLARTLIAPVGDPTAQYVATFLVLSFAVLGMGLSNNRAGLLAGTTFFGAIGISFVFFIVTHNGLALWPRYFQMVLPCAWVSVAAGLQWLMERLPGNKSQGLGWIVAGLLVVVFGVHQIRGYSTANPPIDMYADWRENTLLLESHIPDNALIVHAPGGGAFTVLTLYWTKPTLHIAWTGRMPLPVDLIATTAVDRPVWVILTWGNQRHLPEVKSRMASKGYEFVKEIPIGGGVAAEWLPPKWPPSTPQ